MLDAVLAATEGRDGKCNNGGSWPRSPAPGEPDVVLVEPGTAGTSSRVVADALRRRPHRLLALGVGRAELRHYGTAAEHVAAHGLDAAGLRASIDTFLALRT